MPLPERRCRYWFGSLNTFICIATFAAYALLAAVYLLRHYIRLITCAAPLLPVSVMP